MKNVIYYNAGAGSGKTYKLTHLLAEKIRDGIKPSEVIVTTFTTKAADELRLRSRSVLYEQGLIREAALLDQAAIGTVHSLGQRFVLRFWHLLGLSPNMNVMDEETTNFYINRSLAELPTAEELALFRKFRRTFNIEKSYPGVGPDDDFWKTYLRDIINKATAYRVEDFTNSASLSIERLREIFKPDHDFNHTKADFSYVISALIEMDKGDERKTAQERQAKVSEFEKKNRWEIADFYNFGKLVSSFPKKLNSMLQNKDNVVAQLQSVWHSNQVFQLIEQTVKAIFDIASRWQTAYIDYKAQHRIIDYNDMELYFVRLLSLPEIRDEINGRYKVLMVDEFQDSNPIQVEIFDRLSDLMEQSYWCGDSKQAIYGFRGSDTELTEAIVSMIEEDNPDCIRILDTSYRSEPDVVNLCNSVFKRVFSPKLAPEKVTLKTHKEKKSMGPNLMHWPSLYANKDYLLALVQRVKDFAEEYGVKYKDIAILARTNYDLNALSAAFTNAEIPVNHISGQLCTQKEIELVLSLLSLTVNPYNPMAKAKIAWLTAEGYDVVKLIESKMASDGNDWLENLPLIKRVIDNREHWLSLGISTLIEIVMAELNLRAIMKSWGANWRQREANVYQLKEHALKYEQYCLTMSFGATINGFINWMIQSEAQSAGDENGIVLSTYHKAKGLEWDNVILVSLDNDVTKDIIDKEIFGVHEVKSASPTRECKFPETIISLLPNVFGNSTLPTDISEDLKESPIFSISQEKALAESARLLYVGMTRAMVRLITYAKKASKNKDPMAAITNLGIELAPFDEAGGEFDLYGSGIPVAVVASKVSGTSSEDSMGDETVSVKPIPEMFDLAIAEGSATHAPRYISPSQASDEVMTMASVTTRSGKRIPLRGNPEMNRVGDCIHNCYAAFTGDSAHDIEVVQRIISGFRFENVIPDQESVLKAYQWLLQQLSEKYGSASEICHEVPFMHVSGQRIVRGSIDLVYETPAGCVLVDFKTFPGREDDVLDPTGKHFAGHYGAQFHYYKSAIEASGRRVLASYVYYPVSGMLVSLDLAHKHLVIEKKILNETLDPTQAPTHKMPENEWPALSHSLDSREKVESPDSLS